MAVRSIVAWYWRHQYAVLLVTLLLLLAVYPFLSAAPRMLIVLNLLLLAMAASAIVPLRRDRRMFWGALAVGVTGSLLHIVADLTGRSGFLALAEATRFVFLALIIVPMFKHMFRSRRVEMNVILAASCIYLMIAFAMANLFGLVEWSFPGSFSIGQQDAPAWTERFGELTVDAELLYFSLITLTTVGYGDVIPVSPPARFLAAVEGLIGPLYLAVVLARLVSLELTQRQRPDEEQ